MTDTASAPPKPPEADRGHARTAAALLALAEIPWIVVAVQQVGGGHPPLGVWNLFIAAVAFVVAAGLFLARPLAWTPALVASYYTIGFSILWAAREGEKLLWTSAVAAAAAVAFINAARPRPAPPPPEPSPAAGAAPPDTVVVWVKENLEAIVVAFIMALVIRCFCIEVFKIPSSSMEPTLLGDAALRRTADGDIQALHSNGICTFGAEHVASSGDRIMVTKYYYAFAPLERFDVVVFKFPLNQSRNFIKRVVGLPGEEIRVRDGNIYVRKDGDDRFRIARRPARVQRSVWIDLDSGFPEKKFWNVWAVDKGTDDAVLVRDGELATQRPVILRYKDTIGDHGSGGTRVDDLRLGFDLEITRPRGEVFAEIANDYGRFELRLATDEESRLLWFDSFSDTAQPKLTAPLKTRLEMDRRLKVDLWVQDGLAQAWIDGRPAGRIEFIETVEDARRLDGAEQRLRFGSRGEATFRVSRLTVGRDIHYIGKSNVPDDSPVRIEAGHFLVMGDNVNQSHDSRSWKKKTFVLKDGRRVVAEEQAVNGQELSAKELQDRWSLPTEPDYAIAGDERGRTWALYDTDPGPLPPDVFAGVIDDGTKVETGSMWQIDQKYLVGKALWIWWPQGRWFRLIR